MIDIIKAKKAFEKFIKSYDDGNSRVRVKIAHTYRVAENSNRIAKELGLEEEQQKLAELIGLLHDIGRFEQLKNYDTHIDSKKIDHADLGLKLLFGKGNIRNFIDDKKYDEIIYVSIKNHNRYKIEKNLGKEELLYTKILRDADKLDIYYIVTTEDLKEAVRFKGGDIDSEKLSEDVYKKVLQKNAPSYEDMRSNVDQMAVWIGYVYDINFKESLKIIKEKGYITKIVERVNFKDKNTKEKMKKIEIFVQQYIEEKIK